MNYKITIKDEATYIVGAPSQEAAMEKACEWFEEREPEVYVELTDEPADDED